MKKIVLFSFLLIAVTSVFAQREMMTFTVGGPEKSYNQVRIVNETSLKDFHCRVVILNDDKSVREVYGDYELSKKGSSDSNTKGIKRIKQGNLLGIQFPKSFTGKTSFYVEYRDHRMFDVIVIHLIDEGAEHEDEY